MNVPPLALAQRDAIMREFPATAQAWLDEYPDLVRRCAERWGLTLTGATRGGLPINVIHFARDCEGRDLVLKLGHPHPEQITEMIALAAYGGQLAPALIDCDEELGATLMERICPGTTYRELSKDRDRSSMKLDIFARLGRPSGPVEGLPTYADWIGRAFETFRSRFDSDHVLAPHVDRAALVFGTLKDDCWLLHGDLHHENLLLRDDGQWIAIDPKGVIGPRVLECGRYLHNFLTDEMIAETLAAGSATIEAAMGDLVARRATALAAVMETTPDEILVAGYIDAVLGTCWTVNDGKAHAAREVRAIAKLLG